MPRKHKYSVEEEAKRLEMVATWYYVDDKNLKMIAELLKSNDSSVSRMLTQAEELGVVKFDIDGSYGIVWRHDRKLGSQLRDGFDLDDAMVVDVPVSSQYDHAEDDNLHKALANSAGIQIRDNITASDYIAVAGGRAVYQAVKVIRRRPPARKNIRITPLCGRVWTHSWQVHGPHIARPLDADDAAFVLALAFENEKGTSFNQIAFPLFASDKKEAETNIKGHCPFLPGGRWRSDQAPHRAIVGVGVIDPEGGHRFADMYPKGDQQPPKIDQYLSTAASELKAVVKLVERKSLLVRDKHLPYFGDVANRLFPALPLPDELSTDNLDSISDAYEELNQSLTRLNSRMVVIDWGHIHKIHTIVGIAGGPYKLYVLWTLLLANKLAPTKRIVTGLTTDAESAKNLLAALESHERADASIQNWYKALVEKIFSGPSKKPLQR